MTVAETWNIPMNEKIRSRETLENYIATVRTSAKNTANFTSNWAWLAGVEYALDRVLDELQERKGAKPSD